MYFIALSLVCAAAQHCAATSMTFEPGGNRQRC
jgi:hypothetical protein